MSGALLSKLHVKLSLLAAALMALVGGVLWLLSVQLGERSALEASQRMNLGLADYIVRQQPRPLIGADGRADDALMREMAGMVMKINPAVEVYLLDTQGKVLAHALEGVGPLAPQVDVGRVRELVLPSRPEMLPVLGDDPRAAGRSTIVSVAPLNDGAAMRGYLYVVLQGRDQQAVRATLDSSSALRSAALGIALVVLGAALVFALVLSQLTRPLRRLTQDAEQFRGESAASTPDAGGGEIERLVLATHAMRDRIAEQFKRLEDNDRMRRELIGNISHDLHTPLASVQGYLETVLLRGDALDPATREQHLRTALAHARKLDRRIADLFELSKLDAGRVQPRVEVFCLGELLQDVVQAYRLQAQQRGVTLELAASQHAKSLVRADIALIERVLQNLVDNALRYTPAGGRVQLAIEPHRQPGSAQQLLLKISDTGAGIAAEHLPHIFERYWRAGDAQPQDTSARSAGLGLAIVKRIVELHGSVIRVRSALQQGTTFEFALPQAV
jgi:two-component system, OmpR family, sensor kinase